MSKIALIVIGGSIFFGFLKLVASEKNFPLSEDVRPADQNKNERSALNSNAETLIRTRSNLLPDQTALSVTQCYVCTDCPTVFHNTSVKLCPYTQDNAKIGCVVYAEQYRHMKRPWYIRGCSSERGTCADIRRAHAANADVVSLQSCFECNNDKCNANGASHSATDLTMAFFAMIVTPLIAKHTLS